MSLSERLDSVRRAQQPVDTPVANGQLRVVSAIVDPFAEVKAPRPPGDDRPARAQALRPATCQLPTSRVGCVRRCSRSSTPSRRRCRWPTAPGSRRRSPTRSSATARSSRCSATPRSPRSWSTDRSSIYVERAGKIFPVQAAFASDAHLRRTIDKIVGRVGRRVDEASPLVDARLPDGSRVNAVIPPIALDGSMLTIRKFSPDPFTDRDLFAFGTFSPQVRDCSRPASAAGATSSSRAAPARGRPPRSTCCRATSQRTSGSSPSRTPPSCSSTRSTSCAWRRARPTSRAAARSRFATW